MRNFYLPLLLLFIISFSTSCEPDNSDGPEPEAEDIIEIPDVHFKNALLNTNSIDTDGDGEGDSAIDLNNDGEIQRSEAELIEGLIIAFNRARNTSVIDLTGIENFVNLKYIKMTNFMFMDGVETPEPNIISYDFKALKKLEYLELSNLPTYYIEILDLSGLSNLTEVNLINNMPGYTGYTDANHFMRVNFEGCVSLTTLDTYNSYLIIDFCQIPSLKNLNMRYLEGGEPDVFDFHCLTNLEWLDISENRIKTLILKNSSVLNTLLIDDIGSSDIGNYPYVEYICIDDIPEEFEQIAAIRNENTIVTTDCEF